MQTLSKAMSRSTQPIIAIIGTTGVGKSKLAVELAKELRQASGNRHPWRDGRVLNADAMQVYRGLDVVTNKIPENEKEGIEHCLMGFKEPGDEYVVGEWIHDAIDLIDESHAEHVAPIVAGGTLYWIQHLIFPERLASHPVPESSSSQPSSPQLQRSTLRPEPSLELSAAIDTLPSSLLELYITLPDKGAVSFFSEEDSHSLHELLSHLDPEMAARWHWKDSRKVLRSLEIIQENGELASVVMRKQDSHQSLPRFPTLIFWIYSEPSKLEPRLDARVDTMLASGLLQELDDMRKIASRLASSKQSPDEGRPLGSASGTDFTQGIFQAIGYKEFASYLSETRSETTSTPNAPDISAPSFKSGLEIMKLSTRQYARKQIKWIRNRLIPAVYGVASSTAQTDDEASVSEQSEPMKLYLLDATELGEAWDTNVRDVAIKIMHSFLSGNHMTLPDARTLSPLANLLLEPKKQALQPSSLLAARRKRVCTVCTTDPNRPVMIEEGREWSVHQKSRGHKARAGRDAHVERIRILREEAAKRKEEAAVKGGADWV